MSCATPGEAHAVVGEHVHVVLQVLADLAVVRALEPRLQLVERLLERQLVRRSGVAMRQRDVAGLERLDRQRQADQARGQRIERRRLGVDRRQVGRADAGQPALQLLARQHRLVLHVGPRRGSAVVRGGIDRCVPPAACGRSRPDVAQPAPELVARVELAQPFAVLAPVGERLHRIDVPGEVAVGLDGDEGARRRQPRQRLAQVFADRPRISPARSMIASSEPYWAIHLPAVFGPTFSTPGTLSTASPTSVR